MSLPSQIRHGPESIVIYFDGVTVNEEQQRDHSSGSGVGKSATTSLPPLRTLYPGANQRNDGTISARPEAW